MFSTSTSFCTSQGVTVFPGETCYSVEYDLSAHALLPVGDVTGIATGGHFTISCGPQTSSCSATTGAFAVSAVSPHCDSVHGRANHLVFQTPEANTGLTCV
jgi:hypothetical protein